MTLQFYVRRFELACDTKMGVGVYSKKKSLYWVWRASCEIETFLFSIF